MELIINIYLIIVLLSLIISGFCLLGLVEFDFEINNVWDYLIYSLFWFVHPLKSIIKLIKYIFNC
jgi:hypothetical protein